MKERLDVLLVQKGYTESREKAKRIIMAGVVFVDGQREWTRPEPRSPRRLK